MMNVTASRVAGIKSNKPGLKKAKTQNFKGGLHMKKAVPMKKMGNPIMAMMKKLFTPGK